ncbi:MAG TPA: DUF2752 domain-containing protein [Anaerohalosphaeraceae bacterium]|jgi:hypothetical protein|nr:DUF2752 domain-containing protein [Anaerohalosphaeraceae bacterium]HRT50173.1 DUF2752 domain-containing protein [Anaerohalosphaeraceae bacterium]HRT86104.1 DUF2752 domain-containing protein [Anaerohalosphaeraceae bacterium]
MRNLVNAAVLFLCLGLVLVALVLTVDEVGVYFFGIEWPLHFVMERLFGVKCAFCGMTRSFSAMAHGKAAEAFSYNPLGPAVFLFVVLQIPYRIWVLAISPRPVGRVIGRVHAATAAALLTAILVNWLIYIGGRML